MGDTLNKAVENGARMKNYAEAAPEIMAAFNSLGGTVIKESKALDNKMLEIVAVCVSVARKCDPCMLAHAQNAVKAGVSRQELVDALNMTNLMCGGPGFAYSAMALEYFDDFSK